MRIRAVSLDTVERERERESNALTNKMNQIYCKKIGVLCLYENTE